MHMHVHAYETLQSLSDVIVQRQIVYGSTSLWRWILRVTWEVQWNFIRLHISFITSLLLIFYI